MLNTAPDALPAARLRAGPPRVVYLVSEDWYFMSHRLPMARAARNAGFEVHVATRVDRHGAAIKAEGFFLHPLAWSRGSLNPKNLMRLVAAVRKVYREIKPDLAHHVSVEASIVGSFAAIGLPFACVNAITGLGNLFYGGSAQERLTRWPLKSALGWLLRRPRSTVLVQNPDDLAAISSLGVDPSHIVLIPGSGVDTDMIRPLPEPAGPVAVGFVGRLLEYKGIRTLVAAHELLALRGRDVRLLIAGLPDETNRNSVTAADIASWTRQPNIVHLGYVDDIRTLWAEAHIAALPSRVGEGMPLGLLEAAACGRPLIATDTPGCRDLVRNGVNGVLVPRDDVPALAEAIDRLASDANLRRKYGEASRSVVEREYSSARVGRDVVALYRRLLSSVQPRRA